MEEGVSFCNDTHLDASDGVVMGLQLLRKQGWGIIAVEWSRSVNRLEVKK